MDVRVVGIVLVIEVLKHVCSIIHSTEGLVGKRGNSKMDHHGAFSILKSCLDIIDVI